MQGRTENALEWTVNRKKIFKNGQYKYSIYYFESIGRNPHGGADRLMKGSGSARSERRGVTRFASFFPDVGEARLCGRGSPLPH